MFYFNVITNPCPNVGAVLANLCSHKIPPLIFIMSDNRLVMPANDPTMRQIGTFWNLRRHLEVKRMQITSTDDGLWIQRNMWTIHNFNVDWSYNIIGK